MAAGRLAGCSRPNASGSASVMGLPASSRISVRIQSGSFYATWVADIRDK